MPTNADPTGGPLPESSGEASAEPAGLVPASAMRRLVAFLFDFALVAAFHLAAAGGGWLVTGLFFGLYHTVSLALWGRTLGKAAVAIKVQTPDGARLGWVPALLRSTVGYVGSAFLLLGYLHMFRDARRRTWHDLLFGSEVVQQPGPLSIKRLLRAVDEWTEQLDAWQKRVLARYNRLRGLWQLLLKLTGLITIVHRFVEQVGRWILGHAKATATAASPQAAAGKTGTAAAGTGTFGTATSAVTALAFAGATLVTHQTVAPQALRLWDVPGRGLAADAVFQNDATVLARFEFNGDLKDDSGNGRHGRLLGGQFVETVFGWGLHVSRTGEVGIDWSEFARLLVHPYTIEVVLTPSATGNWGKLFSFDDSNDQGWYYKEQGIQAYPSAVIARGQVRGNERHYLAFVAKGPKTVAVYFQGHLLGSTDAQFEAPPPRAIFFRDDSATGRHEQIDAVVDAMRISKSARPPEEIAAVQQRLARVAGP